MAWIPLHHEVREHPKTKRLARELDISIREAFGSMGALWSWCMHYAQDGDLSKYDACDIADAALDDSGNAQAFVDALVTARLLDRDGEKLTIHNWNEFGGKLIEKQRTNAKRKDEWRKNNPAAPKESGQNEPGRGHDADATRTESVEKKREEKKREENKQQRAGAPGPLSPDSEIGTAVRTLCQKTSLSLSSFDARDMQNLLVSFEARGIPVAQIEEFGRKWPQFWKGEKGAPPGIRDVQEQWDAVLKFKEPGESNGNTNTNGHTTAKEYLAARNAARDAGGSGG